MNVEDIQGMHLFGVENGRLKLDGTVDMKPYLKRLFSKLQSTNITDDSKKLLSYIEEASKERKLTEEDIPVISNTSVFLMYALICSDMNENQLSDMANNDAGYVAAIAFDKLFRENGIEGKIRNRYIWHLVLWKIYCLQYNRNPSAIVGELFLCQFFCIAEIIYMSGDKRQAASSFESVIHLGLEISSQADMSANSFQMLGLSYYYLGCISRDVLHDIPSATEQFANAIKHLERFSSNPPIKKIIEECSMIK